MTKGLKKVKAGDTRQANNNRFKWVELEGEGDDPYIVRCRVRTSLTQDEVDRINKAQTENPLDPEATWKVIYKYVPEWDVIVEDESGDRYEVDAPGVSGPDMFKYAPRPLAMALIYTMLQEVFKKVDPKPLTPAEPTDQP